MANVEKYKDREGRERYAARWRHGTGPGARQMKARRDADGQPFKSARAAMKYAEAQEADARRGLSPVRSDRTVGEYAAYWLDTRHHRPTTRERLQYMFKHFEATGLAKRRLIDVRQTMVQAWASDLRRREVLADSTLQKLVTDLGTVFRSAVHDKLILQSPVVDIQLPEAEEFVRIHPPTVAEVEALAAAMPDRYRAMVWVQAGLGLRVGELLGLTVANVDLPNRRVRIEKQRTRKTPHVRSDLKTRSSKRTVPIPEHVAEEIERHLAAGYSNGVDLFTTSAGSVPHASHYTELISTAARKAGLSCPRGCAEDHDHAKVSSHDLRHHYATELLTGERPLSTVEVGHLLGHKDGTLVERVYGHSKEDTGDRAKAALDALYRRRPDDDAA